MLPCVCVQTASWLEPILAGDIPAPRRAAAAAATGNKIFLFGGVVSDPAGQNLVRRCARRLHAFAWAAHPSPSLQAALTLLVLALRPPPPGG